MRVFFHIIATIVLLVIPFAAFPQVDTLPINIRELLDKSNISYDSAVNHKLVISTGRTSKSVDELPVTIYMISHEDIVNNGYVTLCDVLKTVPGIRVSQPCSGEFGEAFMQRGVMGNTYTKILLNGVDLKPSAPTGMPLGANIPVRQADRIEIVYGPAAASYGNDACSGVINIVTKQHIDKTFASADVITGTGDYHYINFMAGGKFGRGKHVAEYMVYGTNLRYKNMNITDNDDDDLYNRWNYFEQRGVPFVCSIDSFMPKEMTQERYDKMRDYYLANMPQVREIVGYTAGWEGDLNYPEMGRIQQEAAQAGIELRYRGITLSYNYLHRKDYTSLGQTPMLFKYSDPDFMQGEKIIRAVISGDWTFGKFSTNTVLKYFRYRMDDNSQRGVCYSPLVQYMYGAGDDAGFEENISYRASKCLSFNAGVSYMYSGVLPTTNESPYKFPKDKYKAFAKTVNYSDPIFGEFGIYPYAYYTNGVYGQVVWDWKRLSLTGGVRYDYNSLWGSNTNPRIAALVNLTDRITFRASQGYAYKAPSAQQLYGVTAVDASITVSNMYRLMNVQQEVAPLVAYQQVPAHKLEPEKVSSTEFGLRYYLNKTDYFDLVAYTNRVRNPIDRCWGELDTIYKGMGSSAVYTSDGKSYARTYRNVNDAEIKLRGYQFIVVMKNLIQPIHLNINCGLTLSMGHENIYDQNVTDDSKYDRMDHIRQTPRYQVQFAFDFTFLRFMRLRAENVYCSKWARKYYSSPDNDYFWAKAYYNLDLTYCINLSKNLHAMAKVTNVFNTHYGGIDSKEMDVDLPYNPQLLRNLRLILSYDF
ncbi:MAG: TonB-dependent receptor [Bacteroidales bacterium]|nr:TonB-dependent receptor [Bacteroidales bacterium]